MTRVIFRKFPDDGEVIALFPDEHWTEHSGNYIASYMHIGQHGAASPDLIGEFEAANEDEYFPLLCELIDLAEYDDLQVISEIKN